MRRSHEKRPRLTIRRETLRRLGDRQLARVAGGTDYTSGVDPTENPRSYYCWEDTQSYSTGSRYC